MTDTDLSVPGFSFHNPTRRHLGGWNALEKDVLDGGRGGVGLGYHQEPVITLGRHTDRGQVVALKKAQDAGVGIHHIDRGGGATYHGPGQLVIYPVFKLNSVKWSINKLHDGARRYRQRYSRFIRHRRTQHSRSTWDICRRKKNRCHWFSRAPGVVTHGLALNINNDLSYFSLISPCGVLGQQVTSIAAIIGKPVDERVLAGQAWESACHRLGIICDDLADC